MTITLVAAAALAAPTPGDSPSTPYIKAWSTCVALYALPRLESEPAEAIVDSGLAARKAEEDALHRFYIRDNGPRDGEVLFTGVRYNARKHMIAMVKTAKAQRGYK